MWNIVGPYIPQRTFSANWEIIHNKILNAYFTCFRILNEGQAAVSDTRMMFLSAWIAQRISIWQNLLCVTPAVKNLTAKDGDFRISRVRYPLQGVIKSGCNSPNSMACGWLGKSLIHDGLNHSRKVIPEWPRRWILSVPENHIESSIPSKNIGPKKCQSSIKQLLVWVRIGSPFP